MPLEFYKIPPKEFLELHNRDYADSKPKNLESFRQKVAEYLESLKAHKNQNEKAIVSECLKPFLQDLGFCTQAAYKHQGNSEIDLALLKNEAVEVLIEAKKSDNNNNNKEMFSPQNPNCKALHECILYYLREREGENQNLMRNASVRYIIITDFYHFYIFGAREFKRCFYQNKQILKAYQELKNAKKTKNGNIDNQAEFYNEISKILNAGFSGDLEGDIFNTALQGTHFDLRNDKHLSFAHKILSCDFLHNEFTRDSNALNPRFYFELLHILGLKESSEKGKILIHIDESQKTSFAKLIRERLQQQYSPPPPLDSLFEATMSHIILWLNRILFLKLIEANLLHFNNFDKNLKFLTTDKIPSFKILAHLFFEVLAKDYDKRETDKGFNFLPYLNSSLFVKDEQESLDLNTLDDDVGIFSFATTCTEHKKGEKVAFLAYLFDFLECWDFGKSPDKEDSTSNDKLISSSVLGAMFEKLNGYKEGSFYTPNFITSFMCKESLSKIVCEKFNAELNWQVATLQDLRKQIDRDFAKLENKAKQILNSIKICDPAVGSGHFLVSALNEMIGIYHALGLLGFGYKSLKIKDDEIYLETKNNENFTYKRFDDENHQIQIALFNLKKSIIENNLFGVDINDKSCNIARLRLWIELLKNAYYLEDGFKGKIHKLQTLPNIDINIKCGNSLISYFDIHTSLAHYPNINERMQNYKQVVQNYKEGFYKDKTQIDKQIKDLLQAFKNFCFKDKFKKQIKSFESKCEEYSKKYGNYLAKDDKDLSIYVPQRIFVDDFDEQQAQRDFEKLKNEYASVFNLESNKPFEWRFAFPEVLDSNGDFLGFDLMIGNPPYIRQQAIKPLKESLKQKYEVFNGGADIYVYFFELAFNLLKPHSRFSFVTSNKWVKAEYGKTLQNFLLRKTHIESYTDFDGVKVFDSANVDVSIIQVANYSEGKKFIRHSKISRVEIDSEKDLCVIVSNNHFLKPQSDLDLNHFRFEVQDKSTDIFLKLQSLPLKFTYIAQIAKGSSTGNDKAFLFDILKDFQDTLEVENDFGKFRLEKDILVPFCHGEDVKRFEYCKETKYLLYPYDNENLLISKKSLCENYPLAFKYLEKMQPTLMQRKIDMNKENFYKFSALRNAHTYKNSKIMIPDLLSFARFGFDDIGLFHNAAIHNVAFKEKYRHLEKLVLGVLNSKLFWFFIKKSSTSLGGSAIRLMPIYINSFSFPEIIESNQNIADSIIALVDEILKLKAKDSTTDTSKLESEIDSLVYKLYNLSDEEITIID